jgi:3-hydroxy-9,10-secoandrosta-1,3,5(10)-triene-9,17-dione monooxygenase
MEKERTMASRTATGAATNSQALADAAQALLPRIIEASAQANAGADVLPETIAAMKSAKLFRAFQPGRWGGLELDPREACDIQNVFARGCASTAWVYGVLCVQSFMIGRMDTLAQADVWANDPDALVCSTFMSAGRITPVDGGYRISGRGGFSSGSSHAQWALVHGLVPPDAARPEPQMRVFLIPMSDVEIDRVWDTFGLRATGSNDLVIGDAFVPAYRTYAPDAGILPLPASSGLPPLYRLPWLFVFGCSISNLAVGAARGALATFVSVTRDRQGPMGAGPSRENPQFLSVIGRTRVEIDTIERQQRENLVRLADHVAQDTVPPQEEAMLYRGQLTNNLRRLAGLVDEMMVLTGARGIQRTGPLTQVWLDLCAARAHAGNDPAAIHVQIARDLLDA